MNVRNKFAISCISFLFLGSFLSIAIAGGDKEPNLEKKVEKLEQNQKNLLEKLEEANQNSSEEVNLKETASGQEDGNKLRVYTADGSGRLRFESGNGNFSGRIGGRIMSDFIFSSVDNSVETAIEGTTGDNNGVDSGAEFRRARLFTSGQIHGVGYKFQIDFAGGSSITDMYLKFPSPISERGNIKVGRWFEPMTLEGKTSSKYLNFLEYSLPVAAFYPFRTNGASLWGHGKNERYTYGVSLTRSQTNGNGLSQSEGDYAGTVRVTGLPYLKEDQNHLLHVGVSGSQRSLSNLTVSATPEIHLSDAFLNTGSFNAEGQSIFGFETALVWNRISVQGEYMINDVDSRAQNDPQYDGFYIYATYWLTGEHRRYSKSSGVFSRPKPKKNFLDGGPGAWSVGVRYSSLDLTESNDGELEDLTIGINWWMNPHTKIMLNYISADVTNGVGGADGSADYLATRFQIDF